MVYKMCVKRDNVWWKQLPSVYQDSDNLRFMGERAESGNKEGKNQESTQDQPWCFILPAG